MVHPPAEPGVPRPGEVVAGRYAVQQVLEPGPPSYVLLAGDAQGTRVALLVVPRSSPLSTLGRFVDEAHVAARIDSEHVARVHEVGKLPDGSPFMAVEYLEGTDLAEAIAQRGPLPLAIAVDLTLQAIEAVARASMQRVVHRNLKPESMLLVPSADGRENLKLVDFDLSSARSPTPLPALFSLRRRSGGPRAPMRSGFGTALGGAETEVGALGAVLFELLTGSPPYPQAQSQGARAAMPALSPNILREALGLMPGMLTDTILRCLDPDRAARFASVADVAEALTPYGTGRHAACIARAREACGPSREPPAPRPRTMAIPRPIAPTPPRAPSRPPPAPVATPTAAFAIADMPQEPAPFAPPAGPGGAEPDGFEDEKTLAISHAEAFAPAVAKREPVPTIAVATAPAAMQVPGYAQPLMATTPFPPDAYPPAPHPPAPSAPAVLYPPPTVAALPQEPFQQQPFQPAPYPQAVLPAQAGRAGSTVGIVLAVLVVLLVGAGAGVAVVLRGRAASDAPSPGAPAVTATAVNPAPTPVVAATAPPVEPAPAAAPPPASDTVEVAAPAPAPAPTTTTAPPTTTATPTTTPTPTPTFARPTRKPNKGDLLRSRE